MGLHGLDRVGVAGWLGSARRDLALLLQTLRDWPWTDTLRTLRQRFREDRLGQTAGSLTFTTLIALVPLFTVALAVFTVFPMFAGVEAALQQVLLQHLVPESIARPVLRALSQFASRARGVGSVGLVVLLFTALALLMTIDRTLNGIWRVRRPRPLGQRVLLYWAVLTLGPLVIGASLSLPTYALALTGGRLAWPTEAAGPMLALLPFGLTAVAAAALFRYVPHTHVAWRHAAAGAFFVAVGFELAKAGLAWYVEAVPALSTIYGAMATLSILLLWIYLGWAVLLLGAVVAAYAPSLQMRGLRRSVLPGWRFELALGVLQHLVRARADGQLGLTPSALAAALRADPLQLEPVLDLLAELDWVGLLAEPGEARRVLLCDPATTRLQPLIDNALLGAPAPGDATQPFRTAAGVARLRVCDALRPLPPGASGGEAAS